MITKAVKVGQIANSQNSEIFDVRFSQGVQLIMKYSLTVTTQFENKRKGVIEKKRGYLIDLYHYKGFAMLKYYPRHLKDNPNKFKMRCDELGYKLNVEQIRALFWECAKIMKEYLDSNPNNFVGFVGQPDKKDDSEKRRRSIAQRASIYNRYVDSLFKTPKYGTSSPELFIEINLRLIRRIRNKKTPFQLNENQEKNYAEFQKMLINSSELLPELMTEVTKIKIYH